MCSLFVALMKSIGSCNPGFFVQQWEATVAMAERYKKRDSHLNVSDQAQSYWRRKENEIWIYCILRQENTFSPVSQSWAEQLSDACSYTITNISSFACSLMRTSKLWYAQLACCFSPHWQKGKWLLPESHCRWRWWSHGAWVARLVSLGGKASSAQVHGVWGCLE